MILYERQGYCHDSAPGPSRVLEGPQRRTMLAEEKARLNAASTTQCSAIGSIVTFGAGLQILGFITGFESCVVRIRGLPVDALEREIYALFTQQGIDQARLYLKSNREMDDRTREVEMVMDSDIAHTLSIGLDMLEFRDRFLSFEVHEHSAPGKMTPLSVKDADVLTVSWREPSVSYMASLTSWNDAHQKVRELNGSVRLSRRLKVTVYIPSSFNWSMPLPRPSIKIDNVPASAAYNEVKALLGADLVHLQCNGNHHTPVKPLDAIRVAALASGCSRADIITIDRMESVDESLDGVVKIRARFRSWGHARRVYDYLIGRQLSDNTLCRVTHSFPLTYTITIPVQQYIAQLYAWTELRHAAQTLDYNHCRLTRGEVAGEPLVRITICGSEQTSVGALKVKVEELAAAGEHIDGWHPRLAQLCDGPWVQRVLVESEAFVTVDERRQQIKVYGAPEAIARARTMVLDEIDCLNSPKQTQIARVPHSAVRNFMMHGLPELCDILGDENVRFDPATCTLTACGGDETRHIVYRVILEQAARVNDDVVVANIQDTCPICYDDVQAPVRLGCGHAYCTACLRHFLRSAVDSDKFPLVCMGDEARCNTPIAIPYIERFLSASLFTQLLETAFHTYVSHHPLELKYCKTPNCEQVYRVAAQDGPAPTPVKCPGCLTVVCPGCGQDAHETYTCAEYRARIDPAEQERLVDVWVASQSGRVQRCPRCKLPLEKIDGCNHVTCRCGVHICWRCGDVVSESADEIYKHMRASHGSYS